MARKSVARSSASASTPKTSSKHTRTVAKETSIGSTRPRRQSTTPNTKTATGKSKYFESDTEDDTGKEDSSASAAEPSSGSGEEDEMESAVSSPEESPDEETDVSEDDDRPRKRQRARSSKGSAKTPLQKSTSGTGRELWRPGVKAGLGPGTQVIIKKPKARETGNTPYQDDTIHPNTMLFLTDLKANNDRQWLKMHDPDYRASLKDWNSYVETLTQRLMELDDTIPELPVKDIVFRIYRDVRFSKDQTPYKTNYSAAWSRTGRKGPYAAYYIQIKPGGDNLVAGGLWMPEAPSLAKLRRAVDRHPDRLKAVLTNPKIQNDFFGRAGKNEKKIVAAFCDQNAESALKTKPKGFESDHKDIALLRLRSYTMHRKLSDEDVLAKDGLERMLKLVSSLVPFVTYLNSVVMPDEPEGEEESPGSTGDEHSDADASDS